MGIGNSKTLVDPVIKGSGSHNQINLGDSVMKLANNTTAVQNLMNTVRQTASRVIESGGDIITASGAWLKDMQKNWLSCITVSAIILSILAFFYRSFRSYLNRKNSNASDSSLIELANIISSKSNIVQQRQPPSNIPTE